MAPSARLGTGMMCPPRGTMPAWLEPYLPIVSRSQLFSGLGAREVPAVLGCLHPERRRYSQGEYVLRMGDSLHTVPLVVEGGVTVVQEDWWGNRNIQNRATAGETFAVAFALTPNMPLTVSAVAQEDTTIVMLGVTQMLTSCANACPFHMRLLQNLVGDVAQKNLQVMSKLSYLSERTTRGKLLAYLSAESRRAASPTFTIPYNRQQLADYLSVNRSAMCSELTHMAEDGLIRFNRNRFTLLAPAE
jgi:CRP-like cAMP-binding protein